MSDHCSGPRTMAGPAGDICDLYAFTSPEWPGHLALVMTVLPRATADSFFSDAIVRRFRLRPVTSAATGPGAAFATGAEEPSSCSTAPSMFLTHITAPVRVSAAAVRRHPVSRLPSSATTNRVPPATGQHLATAREECCPMPLAVALGDDQVEPLAQGFIGAVAEEGLGARVPQSDDALGTGGDDCLRGTLHDRPEQPGLCIVSHEHSAA